MWAARWTSLTPTWTGSRRWSPRSSTSPWTKPSPIRPQLHEVYEKDTQIRELLNTALKLEGLVRNSGVHAAGVVISPRPLTDLVPLHRTKNDEIVTAFDMVAIEKMGLLKMDFLGLTTLTILTDALKLIQQKRETPLTLEQIPLEDAETYKRSFTRA